MISATARIASLVALVLLAGCATGSLPAPLPPVGTNAATVIVIRPTGFVGGGGSWDLTLDGQVVAEIGNGEHVTFGVAPGEHILGMNPVGCILSYCDVTTATVRAEAGRTYYFRLSMTAGFFDSQNAVTRVDDGQGRALVEKTTRLR
jgi:hypothetical protein